ncbi:MAG: hypothetical protein KDC98_16045 [Planctomycetes bacterium]|nr:hypothetical protein [Planctomycetota bacterium]
MATTDPTWLEHEPILRIAHVPDPEFAVPTETRSSIYALLCAILPACAMFGGDPSAGTEIWHVKAVDPAGRFVDVKAIDDDGAILDVKAIATPGNRHVMDVKCLRGATALPVKLVLAEADHAPLCAITPDGRTLRIRALLPEGGRFDVVGTQRAGNIVHIKAIADDGRRWGVKAISRRGELMDIKGVKMVSDRLETEIDGVPILAHCKALPQIMTASGDTRIWHVKAIHPEGRTVDVKAIDTDGAILDVKAVESDGNLHVMDIKALRQGQQLAVKIMAGEDDEGPVCAIRPDGTQLEVRALMPDGQRLAVRAVARAGNILHVKAIAADGSWWAVKALSPEGLHHDVKGVKMQAGPVEAEIHGLPILAHLKALPQVLGTQAP